MSSHWPPVRMSPELGLGDFQKWLLFGKPGAEVSGTGLPRQDPVASVPGTQSVPSTPGSRG